VIVTVCGGNSVLFFKCDWSARYHTNFAKMATPDPAHAPAPALAATAQPVDTTSVVLPAVPHSLNSMVVGHLRGSTVSIRRQRRLPSNKRGTRPGRPLLASQSTGLGKSPKIG
jgi:hypothetical protein